MTHVMQFDASHIPARTLTASPLVGSGTAMRTLSWGIGLVVGLVLQNASAFHSPFVGNTAVHRRTRASAVVAGSKWDKQRRVACTELTMGFVNPFDALKQGIARAGAGPYDEDAILNIVNGYTSRDAKKVVVFSWTRCPFCKKAKRLVEDLVDDPTDFEFVELDEREDGKAIRYELSKKTGRTSVPQIWIDGEYVGGCNDGPGLFTLMDKGELVPMLQAAGCSLK